MQMTRESEYITIKDVMAILQVSQMTALRKIDKWRICVLDDGGGDGPLKKRRSSTSFHANRSGNDRSSDKAAIESTGLSKRWKTTICWSNFGSTM